MGDVLMSQKDLPGALTYYRKYLTNCEKVAATDPTNVHAKRDLSISLQRMGDILMSQKDLPGSLDYYRKSLAISDEIAAANPHISLAQQDWAIALSKVGDVLVTQGNLRSALPFYRKSVAIDKNPYSQARVNEILAAQAKTQKPSPK